MKGAEKKQSENQDLMEAVVGYSVYMGRETKAKILSRRQKKKKF